MESEKTTHNKRIDLRLKAAGWNVVDWAEWTGNPQKGLKWRSDGEFYLPTGLVNAALARVGAQVPTIPGHDDWLLPSGRSMYEEPEHIQEQGQV